MALLFENDEGGPKCCSSGAGRRCASAIAGPGETLPCGVCRDPVGNLALDGALSGPPYLLH